MDSTLAAALSLTDDPVVAAGLSHYVALLLERNTRLNLTSARTPEAVFEHVRDALTLVPYVRAPYVDVGSGGGLPGLPLALATGVNTTLVESLAKKARFLSDAIARLDVNATVRSGRAEDVAREPEMRATFASATGRALGLAPTVLELTIPFLAVGGVAILQRGRFEEAERRATRGAALVLGAEVTDEILLGGDRRVVLVTKLHPTSERFPRRAGVPAKRPLCVSA